MSSIHFEGSKILLNGEVVAIMAPKLMSNTVEEFKSLLYCKTSLGDCLTELKVLAGSFMEEFRVKVERLEDTI